MGARSRGPVKAINCAFIPVLSALDSIRLGGALTRFTLNGDLQPSSVTFPGADQVTRSFTALHGEMVISSSAPYSMDIKRKITLDTQGR